jgi:hypothetical protein
MKLVARPATPQHLTPWEGPGGDRRWTTVGFLKICSPAVAEITRHLPGIQLIDVKRDPLDFVYRLVGHP